jgi:hypothetical protein
LRSSSGRIDDVLAFDRFDRTFVVRWWIWRATVSSVDDASNAARGCKLTADGRGVSIDRSCLGRGRTA